MDPLWQDRLPYVPFFLAVFVITQFTDAGPAIFAMVAGFLLADWFFISPRHSLLIRDLTTQVNSVIYFLMCSTVLYFSQRARHALARERSARVALSQVAAIIESSDDAIVGKSLDGKIVSWNAGATKLYGYSEEEILGKPVEVLHNHGGDKEFAPLLERVARGERISHFETVRRRKNGESVEVSLTLSPIRNSAGQIVAASTIEREIGERKRAEAERERLVCELQAALREVKTLSGLLPICTHCKKIRDDSGDWNQLEKYVRERSNASFTHGICPECARRHFPEIYKDEPVV
jgi:PAS domain S-box-containing protein